MRMQGMLIDVGLLLGGEGGANQQEQRLLATAYQRALRAQRRHSVLVTAATSGRDDHHEPGSVGGKSVFPDQRLPGRRVIEAPENRVIDAVVYDADLRRIAAEKSHDVVLQRVTARDNARAL